MSRYDLRFLRRHPLRWLRYWWTHLTVALILWTIAATWTAPVFEIVRADALWPIALGGIGAMVAASALAPFEHRLQAAVGASLAAFGTVRALASLEVALVEGGATWALAADHGLLWLIAAALGLVWPTWTRACGDNATVEAGRDDRGTTGRGADGGAGHR